MVGGGRDQPLHRGFAGNDDAGARRGLWRAWAGFGSAAARRFASRTCFGCAPFQRLTVWLAYAAATPSARRKSSATSRRSATTMASTGMALVAGEGSARRPGLPEAGQGEGRRRTRAHRRHCPRQRPFADTFGHQFRDDRLRRRRSLRAEGPRAACWRATSSSASRWRRCSTAASASASGATMNSTFSPRNCRARWKLREAAEFRQAVCRSGRNVTTKQAPPSAGRSMAHRGAVMRWRSGAPATGRAPAAGRLAAAAGGRTARTPARLRRRRCPDRGRGREARPSPSVRLTSAVTGGAPWRSAFCIKLRTRRVSSRGSPATVAGDPATATPLRAPSSAVSASRSTCSDRSSLLAMVEAARQQDLLDQRVEFRKALRTISRLRSPRPATARRDRSPSSAAPAASAARGWHWRAANGAPRQAARCGPPPC